MELVYVLLVLLAVVIFYAANLFNKLVNLRNMVKNQWSQIDVLLKRRFDLIPNLVETVKGYASHEKDTFDAVISARSKVASAQGIESEMKANGELTQALGRLMVVAEAYPDLKANQNFLDLQSTLKDTEDKISFARQFYNDAALSYRNKIEMFPSNIFAGIFGFKPEPFFEVDEVERQNPQVKF
jgi:LemA protein